MRALTYEGPYRVAVRNKPDPRIEHPQDAILRVTSAAICGSDLHLLHGLVADTRVGSTFGLLRARRVRKVAVPAAAILFIAPRVLGRATR